MSESEYRSTGTMVMYTVWTVVFTVVTLWLFIERPMGWWSLGWGALGLLAASVTGVTAGIEYDKPRRKT